MTEAGYIEFIHLMKQAVDSDRLAARALRVRESDKWCGAEDSTRTMRMLADEARALGLASVEIVHGVPGRGQGSGAWTQWEHWTVRKATLTDATSGEIIADYKRNPYHLGFLSAPSPTGGVRARLVVCDNAALIESGKPTATDAVGKLDVRGKLILSRANLSKLRHVAPEAGAVGLIMDGGTRGSADDLVWLQMVWGCWPPGEPTATDAVGKSPLTSRQQCLAQDDRAQHDGQGYVDPDGGQHKERRRARARRAPKTGRNGCCGKHVQRGHAERKRNAIYRVMSQATIHFLWQAQEENARADGSREDPCRTASGREISRNEEESRQARKNLYPALHQQVRERIAKRHRQQRHQRTEPV